MNGCIHLCFLQHLSNICMLNCKEIHRMPSTQCSGCLWLRNETSLNVVTETATILLCVVILYLRKEGRAHLHDSPARCGVNWDHWPLASGGADLEGLKQFYAHVWHLGRDDWKTGLHKPSLFL